MWWFFSCNFGIMRSLPAFSRYSVKIVPHVDVFFMYLWEEINSTSFSSAIFSGSYFLLNKISEPLWLISYSWEMWEFNFAKFESCWFLIFIIFSLIFTYYHWSIYRGNVLSRMGYKKYGTISSNYSASLYSQEWDTRSMELYHLITQQACGYPSFSCNSPSPLFLR